MNAHTPRPADPHRNTKRVETGAKLAALVASLSPYERIAVARLIADEFEWCDDAYMAIKGAATRLTHELLADNAAANGYGRELAA